MRLRVALPLTRAFFGREAKRSSTLVGSLAEKRERLDVRYFARALPWVRPSAWIVASAILTAKSNWLSTAGRSAGLWV